MRFQVGSTHYFVQVKFAEKEPRSFSSLYRPWVDVLQSINVMKLECTEHHKVAWDQDPKDEKEYDGFVFRDAQKRAWHNQYPEACYGQLDDTNDRVVFLHFDVDEVFETKDGEVVYDEDRKPVVKDAVKMAEVEDTFWTARYYLATHVMGEVYRSIHKTPPFLDAHQTRSMQLYLDYLVKKVEEASGENVVFEKARLKHKDGTEHEIDYYVARLQPASVTA